jgi:hypothetical protein
MVLGVAARGDPLRRSGAGLTHELEPYALFVVVVARRVVALKLAAAAEGAAHVAVIIIGRAGGTPFVVDEPRDDGALSLELFDLGGHETDSSVGGRGALAKNDAGLRIGELPLRCSALVGAA